MEGGNGSDIECKIVLVGDTKCGKTALALRFTANSFSEVYAPTGFDKHTTVGNVAGARVRFSIWDTSGSTAYDTVRPLAYQDAKVFLLCFRLSDPDSLENAINKWHPEIRLHSGDSAPVVLCGCQSDMRNDMDTISGLAKMRRIPVTSEQAVLVGRQIGAATYVETSAKVSAKATADAFEVAALAAMGKLNKSHAVLQRQKTYNAPGGKSKMDIKTELKGRAKRCTLM